VAIEDPGFKTVAEVAGLLRVSKMTIYRMIEAGELRATRIGRLYRVPPAALQPWLGENPAVASAAAT